MKLYINSKNKTSLFSWLNQWTKEFRMWCTIFFSFTNAYYNWAIDKIPTIDDIRTVWNQQKNKWQLSDKNWAYLINSAKAVAEYLWVNLLVIDKHSKDFDNLIEHWYMIGMWISVNKEFYDDYKDWDIDNYKDYSKYKWDAFQHALNVCKWKDRFETKWRDYNKEFLYDNYMWKDWRVNSIDVDIKELKDIMYDDCYCLI